MLAFVPARSCHVQFRGNHGTFSPPISYGNLDVNLWCNWTIVAAPGKHIVIYITGFQTNKTCSENHDEIIFEGISSSVENTIVYACWNKLTHVFATQATAVSVVLLWRGFPNHVSNRYFDGRYYVFDDPVLRPPRRSRNCSLTNKLKLTTNNVIPTPIPKTTPIVKSRLCPVLPTSSSSSIPYVPQEPPPLMETDKSSLTTDHLLPVVTPKDDMLHVTRTLAQGLPTIYNSSMVQLPAETQSLEPGGHTVLPTVEDLEPSRIGNWVIVSQSSWTWETVVSETPCLISTPRAEPIHFSASEELQENQHRTPPFISMDGLNGLGESPQFSTDIVTFQETLYLDKANVTESQHLRRTDYIEPLQASHCVVAQTTEPSLIHILSTEFPEPSLIHNTEVPEPSLIHILSTEVPEPSLIHNTEFPEPSLIHNTEVPEPSLIHILSTEVPEPSLIHILSTEFPEPSLIHNTEVPEPSLIHILSTEVPEPSLIHNTEFPEPSLIHNTEFPEPSLIHILSTEVPEPSLIRILSTEVPEPSLIRILSTEVPEPSLIHILSAEFPEPSLLHIFSTEVPEPSLIHILSTEVPEPSLILNTEFPEPSLILSTEIPEPSLILSTEVPELSLVSHFSYSSKTYSSTFTETSQFSKDQTTEKVTMTHFSVPQASEPSKTLHINVDLSPELPETWSFSSIRYTEPVLPNVSAVNPIDFPESKPDHIDPAKVHQWTEMPHISVVHAIGQSVLLDPAGSPQLQILLTKLPLTNNKESYPEEPVLDAPWQVASSPAPPYLDYTSQSHLHPSLTETSVSQLLGHVPPLQVSDQPFQPTFGSSLYPPLIPAKSPNGILGITDNAADDIKSYLLSKVPLSSSASPLFPSRTSILGSQMMRSTHRTTVEQTLDPSSPQRPAVTSDQLELESTATLPPTPESSTKSTYSTSEPQITERKEQMVTVKEYTSPKRLETLSSPTTDHKVERSLAGPMKDLDQWTVNHAEATDSIPRISTDPVSRLSFSEKSSIGTGDTFLKATEDTGLQDGRSKPLLRPTENTRSNLDVTTIELVSEGKEKSTYSYLTNSEIHFHPISAGQPRGNHLDELDVTYFFENQTALEFPHKPGDSLFVITIEIEHKDVVLKNFQQELLKSVQEKIAEKLIYFPSGANSLIIKEIRWTNVNRAMLTFWLQLFQGGKEMRNFLKTQLRTLENNPLGPFNARLISFTVEDVDECQIGAQTCHNNAHCVNVIGSYSCSCMDGYEDHSPTAPGTLCILPKSAELHSLSEHLEILVAAIVTVAIAVLFIIIILCIVQQRRRVKVNLQEPPTRAHGAQSGGEHHGEHAQPPPSPPGHISSRHGRDHHTASDTASTLELTRITIEQTAC
ncbi:uncharacterized protein RB166_005854 [Leptodactylus fuscus]